MVSEDEFSLGGGISRLESGDNFKEDDLRRFISIEQDKKLIDHMNRRCIDCALLMCF